MRTRRKVSECHWSGTSTWCFHIGSWKKDFIFIFFSRFDDFQNSRELKNYFRSVETVNIWSWQGPQWEFSSVFFFFKLFLNKKDKNNESRRWQARRGPNVAPRTKKKNTKTIFVAEILRSLKNVEKTSKHIFTSKSNVMARLKGTRNKMIIIKVTMIIIIIPKYRE